jgi:hypothetical protein
MHTQKIIYIVAVIFMLWCLPPDASAFILPDTGQTTCYETAGNVISCASTGQDGEYNINLMSYTDNGNGTVTDNNTGLMWQQQDDGIRYNWYQASGTYNAAYNPTAQDVCGSLTLGSHSDWRLPTKKELMSIVDYGIHPPGPMIKTTYFTNTKSAWYWSSTAAACNSELSLYVDFNDGDVAGYYKDYIDYVRCVRGGQASAPSLTDNGDGTVTDNRTGLTWQQGEPGTMTWGSALSYCEELSLGDKSDWRLPNIKELESITDNTRYNPTIDTTFFPNVMSSNYWSSTTDADGPSKAWYIPFYHGYVYDYESFKSNSYYVRCKRGQTGSFLGDINGDGKVDISDVILVLRIALQLDPEAACSDINDDAGVDISDVILTLRMALGLDPLTPCI